MIKVACTVLEQFRLCVETDWADVGELVAKIKREPVVESWQARTGSAIDSLLQRPAAGGDSWVGDYRLNAVTEEALRAASVMPPPAQCTRQLNIMSEWGPILLSGRLDLLWGDIICDYKCKFSQWRAEDYEPSLQWRLYLGMTGCPVFCYNFLTFYEPKAKGEWLRFKGGDILRFWAYPTLYEDCCTWIFRFLDWVGSKGLLSYLEIDKASLP